MTLLVGCAAGVHTAETKRLAYSAGQSTRPQAPPTPASDPARTVMPVVAAPTEEGRHWGKVYFDLDKSIVKPEFLPLINQVAAALKSNPKAHLRLEGHTDRHGSREYNVALGQRRAEVVRQLMLQQGVSDSQMEPVSFGKERLAATDATPQADALNRRTEFLEIR